MPRSPHPGAPPVGAEAEGQMDPDRKVELIRIEDRKREQIAAQHWLRRSTLAAISEASPEEPKELPVYLSTPEAVGLIGFGWIRVLDVTGASPYERQYPIVHRMRLVLARVHWWIAQKREKASQGICPIAALRPDDRAEVRWGVRKHGTINVQKLLAATDAFASAMDQAIGYLCAEIAAERLVAWGRRGNYRKGKLCGIQKRIP